MKYPAMIAAALIFTTSAFAQTCPSLAGSYICQLTDGSEEELKISQVTQSEATLYQIDGSALIADGNNHAINGDATFRNAFIKSWCADGNMNTELQGDFFDGETAISHYNSMVQFATHHDVVFQMTINELNIAGSENDLGGAKVCHLKQTSDPELAK